MISFGKLEAIGNATGRQCRPPAHAGEHHPRRRELLGNTIPTPAWISCAGISPRGATCEDQAGADRRLSGPLAGHRQAGPPLPRQLDSTQLRHLDRPSRVQSRVGCAARDAGSGWWASPHGNQNRPKKSPKHGKNCTSPRERLVLVVRRQPQQRPGTACSTACFANICKTCTPCWASNRRPSWRGPPPGTAPLAGLLRSDRPAEREGGPGGGDTSSGSTRDTTSAAVPAAR